MAAARQLTFEAGELADKLHSRSDLALYGRGLKTCRNFFPTVEGQLVSRPGSTLVRETKGSATAHAFPGSAANTKVRLIPFVFGNGQSYVLEFGAGYVRFHTAGGTIESSPGVAYEIASPYSWSSLPSLQFAQTGNIMVLTQPGYDAYVLERVTHFNWTLTPQAYAPPAWPGLPYLEPRLNPLTWAGYSGFMSDPMIETTADFVGDATHPAREWIFALTLDGQDSKTGKRFETLPFVITAKYDGADTYPAVNGSVTSLSDHLMAIYADRKAIISAYRFTIGASPSFIVLGLNVYRGRARDFYGLVGRTLLAKFVDVGDEPNFAVQPPIGTHPFRVLDSTGAVLRIEKPMAVCFSGDRLVYGGAWDNDKLIRVGTMFFSQQGQWNRFDVYKIPYATMALEFELAVQTRQEIRTLFQHQKILIGTDSAVHSLWGAGGTPLDATALPDRRVEAHVGSSHLRFLNVRGTAIFAEGSAGDGFASDQVSYGLAVHALQFSDGYGEYKNTNLSEQASHLFYGDGGGVSRQLIDWSYAQRPWQLVWAVRLDGVLLSLTYNPAGQVPVGTGGVANPPSTGWARHDTDGLYENVCTVPEGAEDAVYVVVRRTVKGEQRRYVERLTSRAHLGPSNLGQPPDDICVDSAKLYFGIATAAVTGLDHLEGKTVWAVREGFPPIQSDTPVAAGVATFALTSGILLNNRTYVGLLYTPEMQTLAVGGEPEKQKTLRALVLELKDTRGCQVGYTLTKVGALKDVKQLRPSTGYNPIQNESRKLVVPTTGTWDTNATAALRQNLPLPCTITGLTRLIEVGGQ